MARISNSQIFASANNYSRLGAEKLFNLQRQLATGKKIQNASDDPRVATQSLRLNTKIRRDEQQVRNIDTNKQSLQEAEEITKSVITTLQRLRDLALQGVNASYTTADQSRIAVEINQHLEGLIRLGNTKSFGNSVFGGAEIHQDAFTVARDGSGEITSATYQGDEIELEIDADGRIPITWPGNRVFAAGQTTVTSNLTTFNGSTVSNYADREIAASFIPTSGVVDGALKINGVRINYDLDGNPTTGEGDSLLDLAASINRAEAGVKASVTGVMQGNSTVNTNSFATAAFTPAGVATAGTFTLNGQTITATTEDTIFTLANKINAQFSGTDVTAEVLDAGGNVVDGTPGVAGATSPFRLRFTGGVEIDDTSAGTTNTNIMRLLGVTNGVASGQNLIGSVTTNYQLSLKGDRPGPFTIEDASGSLAADLGLTSSSNITGGGLLFDAVVKLRDSFRIGDSAEVYNNVIESLDDALQSVEIVRTEAGVRTNRMDIQRNRLQEVLLNERQLLSNIEDVELTEIITDLQLQRNTNQAALRAAADLMQISLLNLI